MTKGGAEEMENTCAGYVPKSSRTGFPGGGCAQERVDGQGAVKGCGVGCFLDAVSMVVDKRIMGADYDESLVYSEKHLF